MGAKYNEFLYGRVGYLFCLLLVTKHVPQFDCKSLIAKTFEKIIETGKQYGHPKSPLMYEWHQTQYFGAAHGLTGILYILMNCPSNLIEKYSQVLRGTIDYLLTFSDQFESGNYPSRRK